MTDQQTPNDEDELYRFHELIMKPYIISEDYHNPEGVNLPTNVNVNVKVPEKPKTPKDIKKYLDQYVIGQEDAKKCISTLLVNHVIRAKYNADKQSADKIRKSNVLFIGDSGTGKTHILKLACEYMGIPLVIEDATRFSATGYVGDNVVDMADRLIDASGGSKEAAQKGIIFIDEFDKLAIKEGSREQINTSSVQYGLLKLVEGSMVNNSSHSGRKEKSPAIDTSEVMFVFAGSFGGLASKVKDLNSFGLGETISQEREVLESDIINYGIIPEILGRIGTYVVLQELSIKQMEQILTRTKNCLIDQYKALFKLRGLDWPLKSADYKQIIAGVKESKLGARGLQRELEKRLMPYMFGDE